MKIVGDGSVFSETSRQCKYSHYDSPDCRSSTHITNLVSDQQHHLQAVCICFCYMS